MEGEPKPGGATNNSGRVVKALAKGLPDARIDTVQGASDAMQISEQRREKGAEMLGEAAGPDQEAKAPLQGLP